VQVVEVEEPFQERVVLVVMAGVVKVVMIIPMLLLLVQQIQAVAVVDLEILQHRVHLMVVQEDQA
jgi:hypothetical protein